MKNDTRIIVIAVAILVITTAVGAGFNWQYAREKAALLEAAEIAVLDNGSEVYRLTSKEIGQLPTSEFAAFLKSSLMKSPEVHNYTGIALADLFKAAQLSLEGKKRVMVRSADGYTVPLAIEEIKAMDNIYLVYRDNGRYLGSYRDKDGQGPYMIVIKGDRFSQRWAKYVCELDVQ